MSLTPRLFTPPTPPSPFLPKPSFLPPKPPFLPPKPYLPLHLRLMSAPAIAGGDSGRAAAVRQFDESRAGVKGLVQSGVRTVPDLFRHEPDGLRSAPAGSVSIPTIDLALPRDEIVRLVRDAAHEWGFFQVINHGIPAATIAQTLSSIRSFNELPSSARSPFYSRAVAGGVSYSSNVDLYKSSAASWRDTIQVLAGPTKPDPDRIPPICRNEILTWDEHVPKAGRTILSLLSEGLGVAPGRLEDLSMGQGRVMVCHYYPACPEPAATMGVVPHTDPGGLTLLVQDSVGGLQVRRTTEEGGVWVDVEPVEGGVVVNVGDLLQIISNDEYKSVEHRAVVRSRDKSRVSIAVFFNPSKRGDSDFYGPLPELISHKKPAHYRDFTMGEFMGTFFGKQLSSKALVEHFKL